MGRRGTSTSFGAKRKNGGGYFERGVVACNPFETLDEDGGEPRSVGFCHGLGLDYVSCSPYRVPLARIAAAQAALEQTQRTAYAATGGGG